jgi:hypothetical protein
MNLYRYMQIYTYLYKFIYALFIAVHDYLIHIM